jgi:hypothetical protein
LVLLDGRAESGPGAQRAHDDAHERPLADERQAGPFHGEWAIEIVAPAGE